MFLIEKLIMRVCKMNKKFKKILEQIINDLKDGSLQNLKTIRINENNF